MNPHRALDAWYVLQLKPNSLSIATTHLARQGYDSFMPLRETTKNTRFGMRRIKTPLFPGYLFVTHPQAQIDWRAISYTRGVARVISGTNDQPGKLPREIAQGLLEFTGADGMLVPPSNFQTGDDVGVINGPFAGWLAKVVATDDAGRIRLLVDIMGRQTPMQIASRDLEKRERDTCSDRRPDLNTLI